MEFLLPVVSFAVVLAGALLFTGAVEWIGHQLRLGEGAVGSILAAVGTATPETLIAIVALIGAAEGAEDVAIGAIVGAPSCSRRWRWAWSGSSPTSTATGASQGSSCDAHAPTLERDLLFFLAFFALARALPGRRAAVRISSGSSSSPPTGLHPAHARSSGGEVQRRRRSTR